VCNCLIQFLHTMVSVRHFQQLLWVHNHFSNKLYKEISGTSMGNKKQNANYIKTLLAGLWRGPPLSGANGRRGAYKTKCIS
jgi:hypothetical protein